MRTREEIQGDVIAILAEPDANKHIAGLVHVQIWLLADIRDLLLASERRTQEFTDELQRIRNPER